MPYAVYFSEEFRKKHEKMDHTFRIWFDKIVKQIAENPFAGKPLGSRWFREKKFGKYRVYYYIFDEFLAVFFMDISDKNDQQKVIAVIQRSIEAYRKMLENGLVNGFTERDGHDRV